MPQPNAQKAVANSHRSSPMAKHGLVEDGCIDWSGHPTLSMPFWARIDESERSVVVTIRLGGTIAMQRIPLNAYQGVVAELTCPSGGEATVQLTLCHEEPAYAVKLETGLPVDHAVAVWRMWADRLCVPLILREAGMTDSVVRPMLGAVMLGQAQPRKANVVKRRRPRFSKRRGMR